MFHELVVIKYLLNYWSHFLYTEWTWIWIQIIFVAPHVREDPIEFEDLCNLLIDYIGHLKRNEDSFLMTDVHGASKIKLHFQYCCYIPIQANLF